MVILICGLLWSFGGYGKTSLLWRRIGVGLTISLLALIKTGHWWTLLVFPLMWIATSRGYGVPEPDCEGSSIGNFWFNIVKQPNETRFQRSEMTHFLTHFFTRITVSLFYGLALIPLAHNFMILVSIIFCVLNTLCWAVYVKTPMIGKYSSEEFLVGAGVGFSAFLAIL